MIGLLILALIGSTFAISYGFDHSVYQGNVSVSSYQCLKNNGKTFAILQAQQSNGSINSYAVTQYNNAKAAGIKYIDWYIFPTINKSASSQINSTISFLKSNNLLSGNMIWIDVEGPEYFYSSCSSNVNFFHQIFDEAKNFIMDVETIIVLVCIPHHPNGAQFAAMTHHSANINSGGHVMMVQLQARTGPVSVDGHLTILSNIREQLQFAPLRLTTIIIK
eukprot:gnl/Chilomastix_caulleri/2002.p1 GENE.gnl/Chilomastix_caulleri/2002~~gnl/Chilomastix_caulleri/2002.p1  ORF type:complete len:220 (-),score=38.12 gnl/Chilomastix_caulleri/2002:63-722(-)